MKRWWKVLAGGLLLMKVFSASGFDLQRILPTEVMGWKWDGKQKIYDRKTIFDYIDGMGEVYLAYNFQQVFVRRYEKPDSPHITVDLFDMGSPDDAFGVWTFERDGEPVGIGQDSDYAAGMLRFWKGRYFVAVWADEETPEVKEAILTLGRKIADAITESGQRPELLRYLPQKGLAKDRIVFFRHFLILNRHYFLADKDILNLSPKAEGILATYQVDKNEMRLILVRYPTERDAVKAQETFGRAYMREGSLKGVVRTENRKWTAFRRIGKVLAIALDTPTSKHAQQLITEVEKLLTSKPATSH